ncbi:hypothetical protein E4A41_05965, partial [Micrococcus endophyticus]
MMMNTSLKRDVMAIWVIIILAVVSLASLAQGRAPVGPGGGEYDLSCGQMHGQLDPEEAAVDLLTKCRELSRESDVRSLTSTRSKSQLNEHITTHMASACHPNQAGNADLGTCQEQTDRFCPEGGEWIIPVSTDTSVDYENSAFGPTECTTSPVAGAGGAR